ncbi:hypothetical protein [Paenibacillus harenae]|uniref:hypothetical protein n=1 Tax=Paenibacillus harenae TaxID=306543 RepID=UPI0004900FEB|nr:hypothetical protein [Paenibacillus harenae]
MKEVINILKNRIIVSLFVVAVLGLGLLIILLINQNPLIADGFSEYNNERKQVDISLVNKGQYDIFIQEVLVNNQLPSKTQLVISYTGQLVAGGIDDDPLAKFIHINDAPIHPRLTPKELQEAVKTHSTPIHYGIRIINEDDIEVVKIKYRHMGVPLIREVNLNTWPE